MALLLDPSNPIVSDNSHRIVFTSGNTKLGFVSGSTGRAYLKETSRGVGFHMTVDGGAAVHTIVVASTTAAESFITDKMAGTIP